MHILDAFRLTVRPPLCPLLILTLYMYIVSEPPLLLNLQMFYNAYKRPEDSYFVFTSQALGTRNETYISLSHSKHYILVPV